MFPLGLAYRKAISYHLVVFRNRSKTFKLTFWIVVGLVALLAISSVAYAAYFADRGLPGVTVADISATGKTRAQVTSEISDRAKETKVVLTVESQESTHSLDDLGIKVDADKSVEEAFAHNRSIISRFGALVNPRAIKPIISTDIEKQQASLEEIASASGVPATNATVKLAEDGQTFETTSSENGRAIDVAQLRRGALDAAKELTTKSLTLEVGEVDPEVSDERAKQVADQANAIVALSVTVTGGSGGYEADAPTKADWVVIDVTDGEMQDAKVSSEKVAAWVASAVEKDNVEVSNGVQRVNSSGTVVATPQEKVDGRTVTNADDVTAAIVKSLDEGQAYAGEFTTETTEAVYDQQLIADGAENLVYPAAPGEHWVEINLSNTIVTAWEGATAVATFYMVPGKPSTPTVTGTFRVWYKTSQQSMSGTNADGSKWKIDYVPWVTYFHGDYALHGAPWFNNFGWSGSGGSHGCINMAVPDAKFIYDWAPMNTVVVSHY